MPVATDPNQRQCFIAQRDKSKQMTAHEKDVQ